MAEHNPVPVDHSERKELKISEQHPTPEAPIVGAPESTNSEGEAVDNNIIRHFLVRVGGDLVDENGEPVFVKNDPVACRPVPESWTPSVEPELRCACGS